MNTNETTQFQIPPAVMWLNSRDTARMLGYENHESFLRDVACSPGFPQPSTAKDRGRPRWNAQEVHEYMLARRVSRAA